MKHFKSSNANVHNGYPYEKKKFGGVIGYLCTCMFPYGYSRPSLGKVYIIVGIVRFLPKCLLKLSPKVKVKPMVVNHGLRWHEGGVWVNPSQHGGGGGGG